MHFDVLASKNMCHSRFCLGGVSFIASGAGGCLQTKCVTRRQLFIGGCVGAGMLLVFAARGLRTFVSTAQLAHLRIHTSSRSLTALLRCGSTIICVALGSMEPVRYSCLPHTGFVPSLAPHSYLIYRIHTSSSSPDSSVALRKYHCLRCVAL